VAEFASITVTGSDELRESLQRAVARLERPAALMDVLAERLRANIELRFAAKVDPDGKRWTPLAQSTKDKYEAQDTVRRGRNAGQVRRRGTLLERTGQMLASLSSNSGDDYAEVGMSRLSDGGQWSVPLLHETGTTRMPRRGIFFRDWEAGELGAEDEAMLIEEVNAFLEDAFGG